jgi:large subunit ribosomal protein L28
MSRTCDICAKTVSFGNQLARRGLAKAVGGVGIKTTGITRRKYKPNTQKIRVMGKDGQINRLKVCTKCIRAGKIRKPLRRDIPEGLRNRMLAAEEAKSPEARRKRAAQRGERRRQRKAAAAKAAAAKGA